MPDGETMPRTCDIRGHSEFTAKRKAPSVKRFWQQATGAGRSDKSTSRFVNWAIEDERKTAGEEARRAGAHRRWGEGGGEPGQRLLSEPFLEILPIQLNIA